MVIVCFLSPPSFSSHWQFRFHVRPAHVVKSQSLPVRPHSYEAMVRLASLFRWTRSHQKPSTNLGSDPDKSAQAQAPAPQLESATKQITQHIEHTAVRDVA